MSFIKDLITLDVVTVTGDLRVKTNFSDDGDTPGDGTPPALDRYVIDFNSLFGRKGGKTTIRGDLKVIAASHIEVDKDTLTFISDDLSEGERELIAVHMETVTMALDSRAAIVARLLPGRLGGGGNGRLNNEEEEV